MKLHLPLDELYCELAIVPALEAQPGCTHLGVPLLPLNHLYCELASIEVLPGCTHDSAPSPPIVQLYCIVS